MSTPTQPTSAKKPPNTAAGQIRSIPSPAAVRKDAANIHTPTAAARTPVANANTPASRTLGSTPMMTNLSQQTAPGGVLSTSPLAGMGTPGMLGGMGGMVGRRDGDPGGGGAVGLGVVGLAGTPLSGGVGGDGKAAGALKMVDNVSELELGALGLTVSTKGRNEDEERRIKMRRVLKRIGRAKGRVSEEGIARVSRRVGFQNDIDAEQLTAEEKAQKVGNRTIGIAGKMVIIDIDLKEGVPQKVQLITSGSGKDIEKQSERAAGLLMKDLEVGNAGLIGSKMDNFAANLDRLARLDRLSEKVNCFDAVAGIYDALSRLYDAEKKVLRSMVEGMEDDQASRIEQEVMRTRSGRPLIHSAGRIGVTIDYWPSDAFTTPPKLDLEIASQHDKKGVSTDDPMFYSIQIEVESCPSGLYPPIRVSNDWLEDSALSLEPGVDIPWKEPPATHLDTGSEDMAKLPDVRFIAKLHPPVIVPSIIALTILSSLGVAAPQMYTYLPYHLLLLEAPMDTIRSGNIGTITAERKIYVPDVHGSGRDLGHQYTLSVSKAEYAYRIEELPFSHPRQIINLLPVLRQWAQYGTLIRTMFQRPLFQSPDLAEIGTNTNGHLVNGEDSAPELNLSIGITTSPIPTMTVTYPDKDGDNIKNVVVQVAPNGVVATNDEDDEDDIDTIMNDDSASSGAPKDKGQANALKRSRALTLCGDVGIWVEWLRRQTT